MSGGEVLHSEAHHLPLGWWRVQKAAVEHLVARLAEVFRQEGVEDGVDAGISIRQTVGDDAEGEGRLGQRESAELHPHGDDVMRHPADGEGGDDQEDRLSRLSFRVLRLLGHVLHLFMKMKQNLGVAAADEQQRQQVSDQQDGHLVDAFGRSGPLLPAEGAVGGGVVAGQDLVLGHRHREHQGQGPNDGDPHQGFPAAPDARGLLGVNHGDVAVHGHGHQGEDAHQHADHGEVVSELTEEGPEHPLW